LAVLVLGCLPGAAAGEQGARQLPASCANAVPPPPVDTSEVPKPGQPAPAPLPVPSPSVGGDRLGGCDVVTPPGAPPPPAEVTADSWIVADLDSGAVLAARNPHARERPASTIKTLIALLSVRDLRMDDTITATQEDADEEGSRVGLQPGVTYTVRDMLTGLILNSGNDAAHALARKLGGVPVALAKLNTLAAQLGARDTRVVTPSGLDGPGMSTSAYDLSLIFRAALRNPEFAAVARTKHAELPGHPAMQISSDNQVVQEYPGVLGAKNGFTDDALHTFVAAAERNGRRIVTALMHGPMQLNAQATRLLDYGFEIGSIAPIGRLVPEQPPAPPAPARPPKPHGTRPLSANRPGMFGTVGGPLTALAAVGTAAGVIFAVRRRRAKLAAAARRERVGATQDRP
jgi:serine-type D-Ala-D-Ala carboxypeptidase (penicillin-binding protein 5/6)